MQLRIQTSQIKQFLVFPSPPVLPFPLFLHLFVLCSAIIFAAALSWAESLLCHPLWAEQVRVLPPSDSVLLLPVGTQWMLAGQRVVWICSWHISVLYWGRDAQTEWSDPTPSGKRGLKNCCCLMGNFSKCLLRQFSHYLQFSLSLYSKGWLHENSLLRNSFLVLILSILPFLCQELSGHNSSILPWQPWLFSQAIFTVWPPPVMVIVQQERQHCVSLRQQTW